MPRAKRVYLPGGVWHLTYRCHNRDSFSSSNAIKIAGYNDIQNPRNRYRVIDFMSLCRLTQVDTPETFRQLHRSWVREALENDDSKRQPEWTEENAVGSESFKGLFKR